SSAPPAERPTTMYTLQRGGIALVASGGLLALFVLISLFPFAASLIALLVIFLVLSEILLIVGLPAIYVVQPQIGRLGQIGLVCIAASNAIAILLTPIELANPKGVPDVIAVTSSVFFLAGVVGFVLAGYATVRVRIFPVWIGWTLVAAGLVEGLLGT